jgi:beta-glucosidase
VKGTRNTTRNRIRALRRLSTLPSAALFCAALGWLPAPAAAQEVRSPVLTGESDVVLKRPDIYHPGWNDLDKNGVRDPYEDPAAPVEARVADLLGRMTLDEKIGQMLQRHMENDSERTEAGRLAAGGLGSFLGAAPTPGRRNRLQREAVEDSRLGIPLIFGFDTIHGLRTVFPIPLGLSAAWDPALLQRVEAFAAAESAAAGIDWVFAPMVDVARDPRWGRMAEGFGEDPWLASQLTVAAVRGFQGDDYGRPDRVAACLKHFVGYGAAEGGRDYNTTEIGLPTLRNVYLPPYRAGVAAGAATVMSAFNLLNGVPASADRFTLTDVLRGEWGFRGFVVSDWEAVPNMIHHGYVADKPAAATASVNAGVDMEMVSDCYRNIPELLAEGRVAQATVDEAVRRILRVKFAKGLFERPYAAAAAVDRAAGAALAREAAIRACVLLKNADGLLPLRRPRRRIALVGPFADDAGDLLGCWAGLGRAEDAVTLHQGLAAAIPEAELTTARGCELEGGTDDGIAAAAAVAREADVVILAVGEPALWSGEDDFRSSLDLPGRQRELFERIASLGKPLVTVLFAGRAPAVPEVLERSNAVLLAWHPGVQGGPAIADLLTGAASPSGRLTATLPRSVGQVPVYYDHMATGRPMRDYRDGTRDPLLPFGFGLTYTHFSYSPTRVRRLPGAPETVVATATIANDGPAAGTEVAQLYIHALACSFGARPVRELRGWRRLSLAPGESRQVEFSLTGAELGAWTPEGRWSTEAGDYEAVVAPDAASGRPAPFRWQ